MTAPFSKWDALKPSGTWTKIKMDALTWRNLWPRDGAKRSLLVNVRRWPGNFSRKWTKTAMASSPWRNIRHSHGKGSDSVNKNIPAQAGRVCYPPIRNWGWGFGGESKGDAPLLPLPNQSNRRSFGQKIRAARPVIYDIKTRFLLHRNNATKAPNQTAER
jgi:hypothetical protein